jgi:asparagine N-glycosylation enzyme membrane subunit Stt3
MPSSSNTKRSLGKTERILAVLFGLGFILGFLLTPLGVETRMHELRTLAFAGFFIVVGLFIPLAGLVSLFLRRPKLAGVLAVIDAVLLFLTAPADQARFFFTAPPPPAVTAGEYMLILVGIGYMLYGPRVYVEN